MWKNRGCFSTGDQREIFKNSTYEHLLPEYPGYYEENGTFINQTYKGCWSKDGFLGSELSNRDKCDWPRPELGYTCLDNLEQILKAKESTDQIRAKDHKRYKARHEVPVEKGLPQRRNVSTLNIIRLLGGGESQNSNLSNLTAALNLLNSTAHKDDSDPLKSPYFVDPFNKAWGAGGEKGDERINICNREQCVDNGQDDWSVTFLYAEWVFAVWFIIEIFLRITTARKLKDYFLSVANIFDIGAVCVSISEVIAIPILIGEPGYEVWGGGFDPGVMRFLRILVTIRFITMQRHFSGLKVITITVKKAAVKLKIPIFFFFICAVVFASIFYVVESGNLMIDCKIDDAYPKAPLAVLQENAEIVDEYIKAQGKTVPNRAGSLSEALNWNMLGMEWYNSRFGECRFCPEDGEASLFGGKEYENLFKYNGTCTSFVRASGVGGDVLAEPKVLDMVDAIWCMIVTMTTVGYGVYYPTQTIGKMTSLAAALFGSFYMAMPLSVVGKDFLDIYNDVHQESEEMSLQINEIFKEKTTVKKTVVVANSKISLQHVTKLKMRSMAAKDRVREMGLHQDEIDLAFRYIEKIESVSGRYIIPSKILTAYITHTHICLRRSHYVYA